MSHMTEEETLPDSLDEDLPAVIEEELPLPPQLTQDSKLEEAKKADAQITNDMLNVLYQCFPKATSIKTVCDLIRTTNQTVKARRDALCLQYGAESKSAGGRVFDPLD